MCGRTKIKKSLILLLVEYLSLLLLQKTPLRVEVGFIKKRNEFYLSGPLYRKANRSILVMLRVPATTLCGWK